MTPTIQKDLNRRSQHSKWLAWWKSDKTDKGPDPGPGFKDCQSCPLRDEWDTLEERADFCTNNCPYEDAPTGPSVRFLEADMWSRLPEVFLNEHGLELGLTRCLEIQAIKEHRQAEMMGAGLFG
jgi:hypothetical protein